MTQAQTTLVDDLITVRRWAEGAPSVALPEIDSINLVIGDGVTVLATGVAAAIRVDFNAFLTGCFLQEFDGVTGSVAVTVAKAPAGPSPSWTTITPAAPPAISSGRYFADTDCSTWANQQLARGDMLRFSVASATTITRVHVALRIRRLEP